MEGKELRESNEDHSPLYKTYDLEKPDDYGYFLNQLEYTPKTNILPSYCTTLLDCGSSFGSSTLMVSYGWSFEEARKFWKRGEVLSDELREKTVIGRRIKTIGLDVKSNPLIYGLKMNIYDKISVQNFEEEINDDTKGALLEADCIMFQHCITYCPILRFIEWIKIYTNDRSRDKQLIYDYNPYFDDRDLSPEVIFPEEEFPNWKSIKSDVEYRNKTDDEYDKDISGGRRLKVKHVIVEFKRKESND